MKIHNSLRLNTLAVFGVALCSVGIEAKDETTIEMPPASTNVPGANWFTGFFVAYPFEAGGEVPDAIFHPHPKRVRAVPERKAGRAYMTVKTVMSRLTFDCDVLSLDHFEASTLLITCRDINSKSETKVNGRRLASPVENRLSYRTNQLLTKAYKNQSFKIKLAPDGQIWGITGLSDLSNQVYKSLVGLRAERSFELLEVFIAIGRSTGQKDIWPNQGSHSNKSYPYRRLMDLQFAWD